MNSRRKGPLLVAGAALLWSSGGLGIKAIADSALKVTFYRSLFAAVALLLLLRSARWHRTATFAAAVVCYAACLTTFVVATKWTTAANAIFLQYAGVVWVLLLSPMVVHEPMRGRDAIAVAVAMSGMALFFVGRLEARGMAGNVMALVSSIFFALLILSLRREPRAAQAAVSWGNVACAGAMLPFVARDLALAPKSFAVLVFLGVFQLAAAYALFVRGLAHVTAVQASLIGMIEPIANPVWVFVILGERPSPAAIAGGAVVLAAIAWHSLAGQPAQADLPAPD